MASQLTYANQDSLLLVGSLKSFIFYYYYEDIVKLQKETSHVTQKKLTRERE